MAVEIVFETHALTEDNEKGIASGHLPGRPLGAGAPTGRRARNPPPRRRFGGRLRANDLHRAVETARIAFSGAPLTVRQDPRPRECDHGELNGCSGGPRPLGRQVGVRLPAGRRFDSVEELSASPPGGGKAGTAR
ncbi:hypothetical protein [Streptomyces virginiae]|uniref:hypothetical protein n=1 Tax=Streptomyces virginiae TaxID=1961 RepID=UPI0034238EB5